MDRAWDLDGYFHISVTKDGVFLTVYAPVGEGERVSEEEVLTNIEDHDLTDIDLDLVKTTIKEAAGMPVKIGGVQKEEAKEVVINIEVSDDKMKAYATVIPPLSGQAVVTVSEIKKALDECGVVYGLDEEEMLKIIRELKFNEPVLVAQGTYPIHGQDTKINYHFDRERKIRLKEDKDGRVNFRELGLIESVTKGQVLATKEAVVKGLPGKTVLGEEIPAREGRDIPFPAGKNTQISSDGMKLLSTIDGQVVFTKRQRIDVEPVLEIRGDVDLQRGNIDFKGTVLVLGNVKEGFVVKSTGDIDVRGCVEAANVSAGGDVLVQNGIIGRGKGEVCAEGSVFAKFAESCHVVAKKDVVITEAIMHSNIDAGERILVRGGRGAILGGRVRAGIEVNANEIGSWTEIKTDIEVGVNPETRDDILSLERDVTEAKKKLNELKLGIKTLLEQKEKLGGELPPDKNRLLQNHIRARNLIMAKLRGSTEKFASIQKILFQQDVKSKVCVFNTVYPGVRIAIGPTTLSIRREYKYTTFFLKGGEIEVRSYEPPAESKDLLKKKKRKTTGSPKRK